MSLIINPFVFITQGLPDALTPHPDNPLIGTGVFGFGSVVLDSGTYHAFIHMSDNTIDRYTATTPAGPWTNQGQVLTSGTAWESTSVGVPYAWKEDTTWYMLYRGNTGVNDAVGLATASDPGGTWTKDAGNPVIPKTATIGAAGAEISGPIKVGSTYYALVESGSGTARKTEIFTSTNLTSWTPQADGPILEGGRFCGFIFKYSNLYWLVTPHYTSDDDEAELELYRSPRPSFRPSERVQLTSLYSSADIESPTWDHKDIDTPTILTNDVTRTLGSDLRIFYAGSANGTFSDGGFGLLESGDPAGVLGVLNGIAFMDISDEDWNNGTPTGTVVYDNSLVVDGPTDDTPHINQTSNATTAAGIGADDFDEIGNTFTPTTDITGFAIEAYLQVTSTPTHGLRCNLYGQDMAGETTKGSPAPIATAETTHTATGWARFEFPNVLIEDGVTYTYLLETTGTEGTDRYAVKSSNANPYAGGKYTFWSDGFSEYRGNTSFDCAFKVIPLSFDGSGTFESAELDISGVGVASGVSRISWVATTPSGSSVSLETRVSTDGGSGWSSWSSVANGGSIPGVTAALDVSDGLVQYRATLSASGGTPSLDWVLVEVEAGS